MKMTLIDGVEKNCWTRGALKQLKTALTRMRFCAAESHAPNESCASSDHCCGATSLSRELRQNAAYFRNVEREAAYMYAKLGFFLPIFEKINHLHFSRRKAPLTQTCQIVSHVRTTGLGRSCRLDAVLRLVGISGGRLSAGIWNDEENNKCGSQGSAPRYKSEGAPLRSSRSPIFTSLRHHRMCPAWD